MSVNLHIYLQVAESTGRRQDGDYQRDAVDSEDRWLQGELCVQAFQSCSTPNTAIALYKGGAWNADTLCRCLHGHIAHVITKALTYSLGQHNVSPPSKKNQQIAVNGLYQI
jgi:hypothetical protein